MGYLFVIVYETSLKSDLIPINFCIMNALTCTQIKIKYVAYIPKIGTRSSGPKEVTDSTRAMNLQIMSFALNKFKIPILYLPNICNFLIGLR